MLMPRINKLPQQVDTTLYKTLEIAEVKKASRRICTTFENDKEKHAFILQCERAIRTSMEYQMFIKFLRDELDMTTCSFLKNISNKDTRHIKIELHHAPFTLYDITAIVIEKKLANSERINTLTVAYEVMMLHYKGVVGIIPLSVTTHKLVHNGFLFIPINYVFGNVYKFYEEYQVFMTDTQKSILEANITASKNFDYKPHVLRESYVYLKIAGQTSLENIIGVPEIECATKQEEDELSKAIMNMKEG